MDQKVEHPAGTASETPRHARRVWQRVRSRVRDLGLPGKLLILTILFVMLAEILIFVPSIANYRVNWLTDRLRSAQLASLAAEASPEGVVPQALRDELLRTAQVRAVALKRDAQRQLILAADPMPPVDATYDLSFTGPNAPSSSASQRMAQVWDAMEVLFSKGDRTLRVIGQPREGAGVLIEVVLPEAPLRAAMLKFGLNILLLSIIISVITAALVYFALNALLVRPMLRLAANMQRFSQRPEDASRIITPSAPQGRDRHRRARTRPDAIGAAPAPQSAQPPRRARPRREQDQSRPAQSPREHADALRPPRLEPRSDSPELRAETHRVPGPGDRLLQRHAALRPRRGGRTSPRDVPLCGRSPRKSATGWGSRPRRAW